MHTFANLVSIMFCKYFSVKIPVESNLSNQEKKEKNDAICQRRVLLQMRKVENIIISRQRLTERAYVETRETRNDEPSHK